MAKRINQGIHECPRDFLRVGMREQPAKSLGPSKRARPPPRRGRRRRRHVPKGRGPEERVRSLRVARFGAPRASLPRPQAEQGVGASSSPPLGRLGDEHTCPFRSQMAKVELGEVHGDNSFTPSPRLAQQMEESPALPVTHEGPPRTGADTAEPNPSVSRPGSWRDLAPYPSSSRPREARRA